MADGRVRIEAGEPLRRRRLAVLFRVLLAIPQYVVLSIWTGLVVPAVAIAWFALLIEGRLPSFLHRFLGAFLRYQGQVNAWFDLLSTRYPDPLRTGEHPFRIELPDRLRQPRLVTLFRLLLALPALVLASVFNIAPTHGSRRRRLRQRPNDLVVLREAAFLLLREDQVPVGDDVELTLRARDGLGLVSGALVQLGRETRGPAVIAVSDGAVEDLDPHVPEPTEAHGRSRGIQASSTVL